MNNLCKNHVRSLERILMGHGSGSPQNNLAPDVIAIWLSTKEEFVKGNN